jgi:uncharacterized protein (DUF1800 family)
MDRRAAISSLIGKIDASQKTRTISTIDTGLQPYTGPFNFEQAAHLLRRVTFGPTNAIIKQSVTFGLTKTLDTLFASQPLPEPPLNFNYASDPNVPIGSTWINAPYISGNNQIQSYRNQSLRAWTYATIFVEGMSLREKMVLFWHNHFVTGDIDDPKFVYKYITLLRENALGNFRELTKKITVDPAMLRYLNGNENTATAPNENYSRELLELFTIGKGPLVGPGDYTNYTEDDVVQMAKVLSGWVAKGFNTTTLGQAVESVFTSSRHHKGTKTLSPRFDNAVITNMEEKEYTHLIDLIFKKDECARFICRKLYRWFVYYQITPDIEQNVIKPMAQILIDNTYEIKPALRALLNSQHFFDFLNVGPMIKHPIDFLFSILKPFEVEFPTSLNQNYSIWWTLFRNTADPLQMTYYNPPSVAGWKAWYQEPSFYRSWINSVTLPLRMAVASTLAKSGYKSSGVTVRISPLKFVEKLKNPFDPNDLIDEIAKILLPQPLSSSQRNILKSVLIPGLPDFEWTVEYTDYRNNPTNTSLAAAVETKLRNMLEVMLLLPEFNLS